MSRIDSFSVNSEQEREDELMHAVEEEKVVVNTLQSHLLSVCTPRSLNYQVSHTNNSCAIEYMINTDVILVCGDMWNHLLTKG
jgi:hypothetical protein